MRLPLTRRLSTEHLKEDIQQSMEGPFTIINNFMDEVTSAVNGNLEYGENLTSNIIEFEIVVGVNGIPRQEILINPNMNRVPRGIDVINIRHSNNNNIPDIIGSPFCITSVVSNGFLRVDKALNLKENQKYIITAVLF